MFSLFRKLRPSQPSAGGRGRTARRGRAFRPGLEALETRLTPSGTPFNVFTWTGAGGDGKWSDASNWAGGEAPDNGIGAVLIFDYGQVSKGASGAYQTASTDDIAGGVTLTALTIQGTARTGEAGFQIGGNALSFDGGGLTDSASKGADQVSAPVLLLGTLPVTVSGADPLTLSGRITQGPPGSLTERGGGTLILASSAYDSAAGTTTVAAGVLDLQGPAGVRQVTPNLVIDAGATVNDNASGQLSFALVTVNAGGRLNLAAGVSDAVSPLAGGGAVSLGTGAALTIAGAPASTFSGTIGGGGGLNLAGGTETLSGSNTYTGPTAVTGGELILTNSRAADSTSGITVDGGATLGLETANALSIPAAFAAHLTLNGSGASGAGALDGISGLNVWQGAVTLASDSTIAADSPLLVSAVVLGSGGLTKGGFGTLSLSGTDGYTGATTVVSGTLSAANAAALHSSSGTTVDTGATLQLAGSPGTSFLSEPLTLSGSGVANEGALFNASGANTWAGPITLAGNAAIGVASTTTLTLTGAIRGTGGLTEGGAGFLFLQGPGNTYAGTTRVTAGALTLKGTGIQVPGNLVIGNGTGTPGSVLVFDEASDQLSLNTTVKMRSDGELYVAAGVREQAGALVGTGVVVLSGSGTSASLLVVHPGGSGTTEYDGSFSGGGGLEFVGGPGKPTWTLAGASPTFKGGVQVPGGATLAVKSATALGTGPVSVGAASTLELEGGIAGVTTGPVSFNGATSLDQVTFGPTGPFALLTTGGVSLNGATLDVSLGSFKPVKGAQFTVIRNGGGGSVTGHFSNPSTFTVGNTTFQIIYKTNEVDLKVV